MELNSIINNDNISTKMKDIYKFIDKNDDKFNTIFDRTYNDIKNLYYNVNHTEDTIEIPNLDSDNIIIIKNNFYSILKYHAKELLGDNSYLISYVYKFNMTSNSITIIKKH